METPEQYTVKYPKNAETLKQFSDTCDNRLSYLTIKAACGKYEPFTQDGLNQLPHKFLPAIAEVMEEYSSELIKENERLKTTLGAEGLKELLAAREENKLYREALTEWLPVINEYRKIMGIGSDVELLLSKFQPKTS